MKRWLVPGLVAVVFFGAATAQADIPPFPPKPIPNPPPQPVWEKARLVIEVNKNVTKAQLIIPRQFLSAPANGFRGDLEQGALAPTSTIVAGVCLSLAAVYGGVWLVRRRQKKLAPIPLAVVLGLIAVLATAGVVSSFALANVPLKSPPPNTNLGLPVNPPALGAPITLADDVQVTISSTGNTIRLIVSPAMYQNLKNSNLVTGGNPSPLPGTAPPPSGGGSAPSPGK